MTNNLRNERSFYMDADINRDDDDDKELEKSVSHDKTNHTLLRLAHVTCT